ncbi:sugar transferase, partial [Thomasclavelia cocleata]
KLGSPVIFTQERPGKNEKIFKMYKFRTMTNETDEKGNLLSDEIRLTKFGKLLRSTSLDELPELFNILKGDMSIVGPRPLLVSYLPFYTKEEKVRHEVRPGLTGLAQVNGRNFIDWDNRLKKDIEYVENMSFVLDIKVIVTTILLVSKKSDVATDTRSVEPNFAEERKAKLGIR